MDYSNEFGANPFQSSVFQDYKNKVCVLQALSSLLQLPVAVVGEITYLEVLSTTIQSSEAQCHALSSCYLFC